MTIKVNPSSNLKYDVIQEGDEQILILKIQLTNVDSRPSASGKTKIYATTSGAYNIEGFKLNLNLYK